MNHRERFVRTLTGKDVDRVPFIKVFGGTNAIVPRWEQEHPGLSSTIDSILQFEGVYADGEPLRSMYLYRNAVHR